MTKLDKSDPANYSYANDDIANRLKIPIEDVRRLKGEGLAEPEGYDEESFDLPLPKAKAGGFAAGFDEDTDISVSVPGFEIEYDFESQDSDINILNLYRIETKKIGCYFVSNYYILRQLAYQNIEKDESCDEPPPPDYDEDVDEALPDEDDDSWEDPDWDVSPEVPRGGYWYVYIGRKSQELYQGWSVFGPVEDARSSNSSGPLTNESGTISPSRKNNIRIPWPVNYAGNFKSRLWYRPGITGGPVTVTEDRSPLGFLGLYSAKFYLTGDTFPLPVVLHGRGETISKALKMMVFRREDTGYDAASNTSYRIKQRRKPVIIHSIQVEPNQIDENSTHPDDENSPMECCDLVRKMAKIMGIHQYPGLLPKSLTGGINGEVPPDQSVRIQTLTDLLIHIFKLDDERIGQFPIKIEIEDVDLTKEGDQKFEISLPNTSEALAEIYGLLMNMQSNSDVSQSYEARILAEVGLTRIAARQAYEAIQQAIDYLGFDYQKKDKKMKMTFTPGGETVEQVLKESEQSYQAIEISDDEQSLKETLADLLNAAAIIRATHFRKVNPRGDVKEQIMNNLKRGVEMYKRMENLKKDGGLDWDEFKQKVEDNWLGDTNKSDNPTVKDIKLEKPPKP